MIKMVVITIKEQTIMGLFQVDSIEALILEQFLGYYCKKVIVLENMSAFMLSKVKSVSF